MSLGVGVGSLGSSSWWILRNDCILVHNLSGTGLAKDSGATLIEKVAKCCVQWLDNRIGVKYIYEIEFIKVYSLWGFPSGSVGENLPVNAGDVDSTPGSGRSLGEGNGNPLQYSCLENPTDRGAWQATIHGVSKESDRTEWLNNKLFSVHNLASGTFKPRLQGTKSWRRKGFSEVYFPCFFLHSDRTVSVFYSVFQCSKMACSIAQSKCQLHQLS